MDIVRHPWFCLGALAQLYSMYTILPQRYIYRGELRLHAYLSFLTSLAQVISQ